MKQNQIKFNKASQWALAIMFSMIATSAMAAGFEQEAKGLVEKIRDGIYIVVGVIAGITLLWQFVEGWMGRKTWGDILNTSMWVVGGGAAIVFATWLFTAGGKMSF